jgi:hypothetical protein
MDGGGTGAATVDVLMVTHRWPSYAHLSLQRLLETCDENMRVWIWHNGSDTKTLEVVRSFLDHDAIAGFEHSPENQKLRAPTNWMWAHGTASYVAKVDDDCLVDPSWADTLRAAHANNPSFGVIGSWRFYDEDFVPELAERKIQEFAGGHRLMRNPWVQGSGYLMKRECIEAQGLLAPEQAFTTYCIDLALRGYQNGWYFPFIHEEHLDDPRSPWTGLRTDADLLDRLPLSARRTGVQTLADWDEQMRRSARALQAANPDPRSHSGWRKRRSNLRKRLIRRPGEL